MTYYPFYIAIMVLESCLLWTMNSRTEETITVKRNNKVFVILVTIQFLLLLALRNSKVGADTQYYIEYFQAIDDNYTWSQLGRYLAGGFLGERRWFEPLFTLFVKCVHTITGNPQIFLTVIAIIIMIPLGRFVYGNSRNVALSFMIYMCLFFQCFGITAIRQSLALSISVLWGYHFVKERKLWKFLVCVVIGMLFHISAVVILPLYFVYHYKPKKVARIVYVGIVIILLLFHDQIITVVSGLTGLAYAGSEGAKAFNMVIIMLAITLFCLWKYDKLIEIREENKGIMNAVLLGTLILPFSQVDSVYMRLSYFYYMFLMILIPEILLLFPPKWKNIFTVCAYAGMIALFARHGLQYSFFWQA